MHLYTSQYECLIRIGFGSASMNCYGVGTTSPETSKLSFNTNHLICQCTVPQPQEFPQQSWRQMSRSHCRQISCCSNLILKLQSCSNCSVSDCVASTPLIVWWAQFRLQCVCALVMLVLYINMEVPPRSPRQKDVQELTLHFLLMFRVLVLISTVPSYMLHAMCY